MIEYVGDGAERKCDKSLLPPSLHRQLIKLDNLFFIKPAQPICGPFKEDASTTLACGSICSSGESPSWTAGTPSGTHVAACQGNTCLVLPAYSSYLTISPTGSTLTINSVSRSDPFNMETRWTCRCGGSQNTDTVCQGLQVYGQLLFSPL